MLTRRGLSFVLQNDLRNIFSFCCGRPHNQLLTPLSVTAVRWKWNDLKVDKPVAGDGYYRRTVHYPKDYTLEPIPTTNLGGRDPNTGRKVVGMWGGGLKHPYLWIDYKRIAPKEGPPVIERVLEVREEPNRTAHVALVGGGDKLRYIIATENMKPGDIIKTDAELTRIAIRPKEGDCHPVGSLPAGTIVCCVEVRPGEGGYKARAAGTFCTVLRKQGPRVVLIQKNQEFSILRECMAVVGKVSNAVHSSIHIGSANRLRLLGYRPRSGLWQRKTGRDGRKIKPPPKLREYRVEQAVETRQVWLTLDDYPDHKPKDTKYGSR